MSDENPYQSAVADSATEQQTRSRWRFWGWVALFTYPISLVLCFYLAWAVAWIILGHRPRPNLDDPKSLGALSTVIVLVPGVLIATWPVCMVIGLVSAYCCPAAIRKSRTLLVFTYLMLCGFAWTLLRTDPWQVVEWWFD